MGSDSRSEDMGAEEARFLTELITRERKLNPAASIAVLVRARAHLEALVAEIRSRQPDLRFQAVEIEQLAGRQAVQDIHALTCALFHRSDRVNWLAILRAPWCGLTLADLHALAADKHYANIWQLMQDEARLSRLSDDGRQRLLHVRDVIAEAYAHQGRQPMRRWVESVWLKLGGAACLWEAGDVRDVQAFLDLLERMQMFDAAELQSKMEKLYAAPDVQADASLQFMTIHKSKGLEFDSVILPGLHRTPRKQDSPLLLWEDVAIEGAPSQLVAAPYVPRHKRDGLPSTYDYLQSLEQERDANEVTRVLYVAATRTRRRLHLVAAVKPDGKGEIKAPANTLLGLLWDSVGGEFLNAEPRPEVAAPENSSAFIPSLIRLPQTAVPTMLQSSAPEALATASCQAAAEEKVATFEASCGTLAHLYMEMFARDGVEHWPATRVESLGDAMARWLTQHGHAQAAAQQGALELVEALKATLESERGQWVLRSRPDASAELALSSANADGVIATHVVDRTFVEDGERWIIDYKLVRHEGGGLDKFLQQRAEEYRPQLERYAALFEDQGLPLRKAVYFIAQGLLACI
jgi:ATP-dependent helicase/nuclease subunit A